MKNSQGWDQIELADEGTQLEEMMLGHTIILAAGDNTSLIHVTSFAAGRIYQALWKTIQHARVKPLS